MVPALIAVVYIVCQSRADMPSQDSLPLTP
jgi:hypothetical protein